MNDGRSVGRLACWLRRMRNWEAWLTRVGHRRRSFEIKKFLDDGIEEKGEEFLQGMEGIRCFAFRSGRRTWMALAWIFLERILGF